MSALDRLSGLLRKSLDKERRPLTAFDGLDAVIAGLQQHIKAGASSSIPEDMQQVAVRKFWDVQKFETFKDARLVSFGMCVPSGPARPCIMEDRQRFQAVLDGQTGIDQWVKEPRWYRRCYQGLVHSYFKYDAKAANTPSVGKSNWSDLRDYLDGHTQFIVDNQVNPEWVGTTVENRQLFGQEPCAPYASELLLGNSAGVEHLCQQLGIVKSSWFLQELVLAQVQHATTLSNDHFVEFIPRLLELLGANLVLRDRGLILLLNKYASQKQAGLNEPLRNASVEWWGNPWLPSNQTRWGGVAADAREMVSEWLKREFIEAFFTKLAEDGVGDRRRANFWLRYVKAMGNIQFALGSKAMRSRDRDFEALRKKMKGLYTELKTTDSSNNAFIMTLGDLVAVEFGGMGNAFYGYDIKQTLPFDATRPLGVTVNAPNSLKHRNRILWMQHQDGIKGWSKWEDMFEATLKEHFNIHPLELKAQTGRGNSRLQNSNTLLLASGSAAGASKPFTPANEFDLSGFLEFAHANGLEVEDLRERNGNFWVRTLDNSFNFRMAMKGWGFTYRDGRGWWR